jgi:hypothetical protein
MSVGNLRAAKKRDAYNYQEAEKTFSLKHPLVCCPAGASGPAEDRIDLIPVSGRLRGSPPIPFCSSKSQWYKWTPLFLRAKVFLRGSTRSHGRI